SVFMFLISLFTSSLASRSSTFFPCTTLFRSTRRTSRPSTTSPVASADPPPGTPPALGHPAVRHPHQTATPPPTRAPARRPLPRHAAARQTATPPPCGCPPRDTAPRRFSHQGCIPRHAGAIGAPTQCRVVILRAQNHGSWPGV